MKSALLLLSTVLLAACSSNPTKQPEQPFAVLLGTAQDGGLPQIGCREDCCEAARRNTNRSRLVASLLVVDPASARSWLIDATPDLPEQVERAQTAGVRPMAAPYRGRPPLFDGIFLTHVHLGHYAGLAFLGPEAYAAKGQALFGSYRMLDFLEDHAPNELSIQRGHLLPYELKPDTPLELSPGLTITALPVPHREEYSDTYAYRIQGPRRSLLYLPDIDKWERWDVPLEDALASVDVALLDGTFYADGEIPGRAMDEIPHPFIVETMQRLESAPAELRAKVVFTHLNHTNPAADESSAAHAAVLACGMRVARDGQRIDL